MFSYINLPIEDKFAFVEDPCGVDYKRNLLTEFVSLRRYLFNKREMFENYESFISKHGSLTIPSTQLVMPCGVDSFLSNLQSVLLDGSRTIYIEPRSLWSFHIDTMRDLAILHMILHSKKDRIKVVAAQMIVNNCIVYSDSFGEQRCLFHATNGIGPKSVTPAVVPDGVPSDIASYLALFGEPFCYSAPYAFDNDLIGKRVWLTENARDILDAYLSQYCLAYEVTDASMLAHLQRILKEVLLSDHPLVFCLMCGRATFEHGSIQAFDTPACAQSYYRNGDDIKEFLREGGGYSEQDIAEMFCVSRTKYGQRKKK